MNLTHFPQIWLDDWNSHDIDRILAHYDEAVRFHSPRDKPSMGWNWFL